MIKISEEAIKSIEQKYMPQYGNEIMIFSTEQEKTLFERRWKWFAKNCLSYSKLFVLIYFFLHHRTSGYNNWIYKHKYQVEEDMNKTSIISKLKVLGFDTNEYWIIAGVALVLHGLRKETADIDLACTKELFNYLLLQGYVWEKNELGYRKISLEDIEVFEE